MYVRACPDGAISHTTARFALFSRFGVPRDNNGHLSNPRGSAQPVIPKTVARNGPAAAKASGAIVFRPTPTWLRPAVGRVGAQVVLHTELASLEGPLTNRRRSVRLGLCFLDARRYTKAPYGIVIHFFEISLFQRKQFEPLLAARPNEEVQAGSSGPLKTPLPGGIGHPTGKTSEGRCAELSKSPPARKADRYTLFVHHRRPKIHVAFWATRRYSAFREGVSAARSIIIRVSGVRVPTPVTLGWRRKFLFHK